MNSSPVHLIIHVMAVIFPINQCCGSRMFIPDPDFYPPDPGSRNPDPATKRKVERKKYVFLPFFLLPHISQNWKFEIFEQMQKKFEQTGKKLYFFLSEKLWLSSRKYGLRIRDLRSGNLDPELTYPESRHQKGTESRIPDTDPQHYLQHKFSCQSLKENRFSAAVCFNVSSSIVLANFFLLTAGQRKTIRALLPPSGIRPPPSSYAVSSEHSSTWSLKRLGPLFKHLSSEMETILRVLKF